MSHKSTLGLAAAFLSVVLVLPTATRAEGIADLFVPTTHKTFATLSWGPSIGMSGLTVTQYKMSQGGGLYLRGKFLGPAIGGEIEESFGEGLFRFQLGPKAWWNFQPKPQAGFYITPCAKLGYMLAKAGSVSAHYLNIQVGVEGRLVLSDRVLFYFRPLTLDMGIGGGDKAPTFTMSYDLMFAAGVAFADFLPAR